MQGKLKLLCLALATFACGYTITATVPRTEAQENTLSEHRDIVAEILPYPFDFVRARILTQFDSDARSYYEDYNRHIYALPEKVLSYKDLSPKAYETFMALPMVKPDKFYVFYGAYAVKQKRLKEITPVNMIGVNNPALVRYASLPQQQRMHDIYLWSPDVPYWYSEYKEEGAALPFRSYFILHLSAAGENATNVEVIQDKPVVRLTDSTSLDEHGNLMNFTLRDVPPTTRDRVFLLSCIKQFIEREVPTRKQFACKNEAELEADRKAAKKR